jgi:hypothetical protein
MSPEQQRSDAWYAVWNLCLELGMSGEVETGGQKMVLDFIKELHVESGRKS